MIGGFHGLFLSGLLRKNVTTPPELSGLNLNRTALWFFISIFHPIYNSDSKTNSTSDHIDNIAASSYFG
jgi:hypothetical protein